MRPAAARPPIPTSPPSLYFVVVGSQDYAFSSSRFRDPFEPVFAPEHSARRVADVLMASGAAFGILLTSDSGRPGQAMVTRDDMLKAIGDLKTRIRADHAANPRIVFYIMGHGLGDRATKFAYLVPGNMIFDRRSSQTVTLRLLKRTVSDLDVVSALVNFRVHPSMSHLDRFFPTLVMADPHDAAEAETARNLIRDLTEEDEAKRRKGIYPPEGNPPVPFVALFDNCYGGVVQNLVDGESMNWLARQWSRQIEETLAEVRSDGVVLYAAEPGGDAGDFADPANESGDPSPRVGALAARLLRMQATGGFASPLSFGDFRRRMLAPWANGASARGEGPPVPYSPGSTIAEVLAAPLLPAAASAPPGTLDRRSGTGATTVGCCGE